MPKKRAIKPSKICADEIIQNPHVRHLRQLNFQPEHSFESYNETNPNTPVSQCERTEVKTYSLNEQPMSFYEQVQLAKKLLSRGFVIDPESKYVQKWDCLLAVALFFTATVTPFEVVFLPTKLNTLFFFNIVVNFIFVQDMLLNFFMAYWEQDCSVGAGGVWIKQVHLIRKRYFRMWFWVDFCSIFPYDVVSFLVKYQQMSRLKIFKTVRLLRLLKLIRMLKISKLLQRIEIIYPAHSFSVKSLIKLLLIVFFAAHWIACLWSIIGLTYFESHQQNWISKDSILHQNLHEFDISKYYYHVYFQAFYFAVASIAGIGYGDITPSNTGERWVCILIMFVGCSIWDYVLVCTSESVSTMHYERIYHHRMMDSVNLFVKDQRFEKSFQIQLRSYFNALREVKIFQRDQDLINEMCPKLRDFVALKTAPWTKKIRCLKGISNDCVSLLVQTMEVAAFIPFEIMPSINYLCVINRGVAFKCNKILLKGDSYGDDLFLQSNFLKDKTPAHAITLTEIMFINRCSFFQVVNNFPVDTKRLRQLAIKTALHRALLLIRTFSKCNWKFSNSTKIPFIAPQLLNKGMGEKYEKYVQNLKPHLSMDINSSCNKISQLMIETEEQDIEDRDIIEMLGSGTKPPSRCHHFGLDIQVRDIESRLQDFEKHLSRLETSITLCLRETRRLIWAKFDFCHPDYFPPFPKFFSGHFCNLTSEKMTLLPVLEEAFFSHLDNANLECLGSRVSRRKIMLSTSIPTVENGQHSHTFSKPKKFSRPLQQGRSEWKLKRKESGRSESATQKDEKHAASYPELKTYFNIPVLCEVDSQKNTGYSSRRRNAIVPFSSDSNIHPKLLFDEVEEFDCVSSRSNSDVPIAGAIRTNTALESSFYEFKNIKPLRLSPLENRSNLEMERSSGSENFRIMDNLLHTNSFRMKSKRSWVSNSPKMARHFSHFKLSTSDEFANDTIGLLQNLCGTGSNPDTTPR